MWCWNLRGTNCTIFKYINYEDININGEVWVEYDDLVVIYVTFNVYDRGRPLTIILAHGGENVLPVIGDTIYVDTSSIMLPNNPPGSYELYHEGLAQFSPNFNLQINQQLNTVIHLDPNSSVVTGITSDYTLLEGSNIRGEVYHDGENVLPVSGDTLYYYLQGEGSGFFSPINNSSFTFKYLEIDNDIYPIDVNSIVSEKLPIQYKTFNINQVSNELLLHTNTSTFPEFSDTIYIYDYDTSNIITNSIRLTNISSSFITTENSTNYIYEYDLNSIITDKRINNPSV